MSVMAHLLPFKLKSLPFYVILCYECTVGTFTWTARNICVGNLENLGFKPHPSPGSRMTIGRVIWQPSETYFGGAAATIGLNIRLARDCFTFDTHQDTDEWLEMGSEYTSPVQHPPSERGNPSCHLMRPKFYDPRFSR